MKKTVFITGGSGGIGGAAARYFQAKGWKVILPVRDLSNLDVQTLMKLPNIEVYLCDIGKKSAITDLLVALKKTGEKIDTVFLAAGTFKWDDTFETEENAKEFLLSANYETKMNVVNAFNEIYTDSLSDIGMYFISSHAAHFTVAGPERTGKYREEGYVYAMARTSAYGVELAAMGTYRYVRVLEPGLIDTIMAREEFTEERIGWKIDWSTVPTPDGYIKTELTNAVL